MLNPHKLPLQAKKLFVSAYNKASVNKEETAWRTVSSIYSPRANDRWVMKHNIDLHTSINKSGFFLTPSYYFNAILSTTDVDSVGQHASDKLLKKLADNNLIDETGDVDHLTINGIETKFDGIFKKINHAYKDSKLHIKFAIDKTHKYFKDFVKQYGDKKALGLSAEYKNARVRKDEIVYASSLGFTVSYDTKPRNSEAKIISQERK